MVRIVRKEKRENTPDDGGVPDILSEMLETAKAGEIPAVPDDVSELPTESRRVMDLISEIFSHVNKHLESFKFSA